MRNAASIVFTLLVACATTAAPVGAATSELAELSRALSSSVPAGSPTLAVVSLTRADGSASPFGAWVADELTQALAKTHRVVERTRLDAVLRELALADLGVVTRTTAELGDAIGAELLVVGTVTPLKDGIDVNARLVRTESAEVVATAETRLDPALGPTHGLDQSKPQSKPPLALSLSVLGERETNGRYEHIVVREDTVLHSGDGLKLTFETNRDAYVYLLLLDSSGAASLLFPQDAIAVSSKLRGGESVEIPPDNQWFFLDQQTGRETLYALAGLEPIEGIGELLGELEALDARRRDEAVARIANTVVTRGIGGIRPGRSDRVKLSDGQVVDRSRELLVGTGAVVRAITFIHR